MADLCLNLTDIPLFGIILPPFTLSSLRKNDLLVCKRIGDQTNDNSFTTYLLSGPKCLLIIFLSSSFLLVLWCVSIQFYQSFQKKLLEYINNERKWKIKKKNKLNAAPWSII